VSLDPRDLEKAQPNKGHGSSIDGTTKIAQLEAAGLSKTTANRFLINNLRKNRSKKPAFS
jgi:hypothetical protein